MIKFERQVNLTHTVDLVDYELMLKSSEISEDLASIVAYIYAMQYYNALGAISECHSNLETLKDLLDSRINQARAALKKSNL